MTAAELLAIVEAMERWQVEDLVHQHTCVRCKSWVHTPSDFEPTPLCDPCAQTLVDALSGQVAAMRPVVEAAERAYDFAHAPDENGPTTHCDCEPCQAVRAYRALP